MLPSSLIAGVSIVCAVGPWLFTEPLVLRGLAAAAAVTTVLGAVVMRRWDVAAGKHVADLARARTSDEWRHEERVAELESDLEESRELRTKLEQRLRAKRAELAKLRNEHAALLRRYATAETERATALEGRRLLAIETTVPQARALPAGTTGTPDDSATPGAAESGAPQGADVRDAEGEEPTTPGVFSPEGSALYLRADSALARLVKDGDDEAPEDPASEKDAAQETAASAPDDAPEQDEDAAQATEDGTAESVESVEADETVDGSGPAKAAADAHQQHAPSALSALTEARAKTASESVPPKDDGPGNGGGRKGGSAEAGTVRDGSGAEDEGQPTAAAGREHESAPTAQQPQPAATKPAHATGHFTVPTAVAVVPAAPPRRPSTEGGFDFFGTKGPGETLTSVQNEDLADVVGQEALAMHKEESESGFKPADPEARGVGQVIDLTAHDETEQIDLQGLRTAAS
ncbi:hypothetical protein [Streptomyces gibsoniae]|uniref:hypothetical protein n=1 Tax=Streptomyces gibsoniae TaxID=3075529 RepID=UPI00374E1B0A